MSRDGKLLAIATNTSCKIFVLSRRKDGSSIRRVRRLESEILASQGARHVQFSPDGHWLLTIQPNNGINVYSIQIDAISKVGYRIEKHPTILKRLERDSLMIDPLRTYRSTVCKLTWSEDSTTIVSADLDGNMDIWSLNEENLKVNGVSKSGPPVTNGNTNGTTIDADTSEESDDEQSEYSSSTDNPPWKLLRFKLPKLPASPLLLSFRSGHESDDRLIVVTLRHEILEFHTRTGRLTDWSKRNPSSQLPSQFSQIKDRVMGCVWDCSNQRQRLWLYGSTFLFMFDMSKDLVIKPKNLIIQDGNRKRKRSRLSDGRDLNIKKNNGAGDFAAYQNDFGLTDLSHPTNKSSRTTTEDDDEEDKDEDDQASLRKGEHKSLTTSLLQLRRQTATATAEDQPDTDIDNEAETSDPTAEREKKPAARKNQSWWFTHKYRPILGLVTLARDVEAESDDEHGYAIGGDLEVALVERPLWDLDLDLPFLS